MAANSHYATYRLDLDSDWQQVSIQFATVVRTSCSLIQRLCQLEAGVATDGSQVAGMGPLEANVLRGRVYCFSDRTFCELAAYRRELALVRTLAKDFLDQADAIGEEDDTSEGELHAGGSSGHSYADSMSAIDKIVTRVRRLHARFDRWLGNEATQTGLLTGHPNDNADYRLTLFNFFTDMGENRLWLRALFTVLENRLEKGTEAVSNSFSKRVPGAFDEPPTVAEMEHMYTRGVSHFAKDLVGACGAHDALLEFMDEQGGVLEVARRWRSQSDGTTYGTLAWNVEGRRMELMELSSAFERQAPNDGV